MRDRLSPQREAEIVEAIRGALDSVQGTQHHLPLGTLRVLTERLTEALTSSLAASDADSDRIVEQVVEWGVQLAPHMYIARHAHCEDATALIAQAQARGETPRLLHRTVSFTAWVEVQS